MAGTGLDALMIRDADGGLKDRFGRAAYIWTGARHLRSAPVRTKVEVDGHVWFDGKASCVLVANVGAIAGGVTAFDHASPDDGALDVAVVTADGAWQWPRTLTRAAVGHAENSPLVQVTQATKIKVDDRQASSVRARWWRPQEDGHAAHSRRPARGDHPRAVGGERRRRQEMNATSVATDAASPRRTRRTSRAFPAFVYAILGGVLIVALPFVARHIDGSADEFSTRTVPVLPAIGWVVCAALAAIVVTHRLQLWFTIDEGSVLAVAYDILPLLLFVAPPIAIAAVASGHTLLAAAATGLMAYHALLVIPRLISDRPPTWARTAPTLRLRSRTCSSTTRRPKLLRDSSHTWMPT